MNYALHFGLDKPSYRINDDTMKANSCVASSVYYHELSLEKGFTSRHFPNEKATSYRLLRNLRSFSKKMKAGDLLFLTYCGHGTSIASRGEFDKSTETLILYDRLFLDQELKRCLSWFDKDVCIFIVTNSCNNGTLFQTETRNNISKMKDILTEELYADIYGALDKYEEDIEEDIEDGLEDEDKDERQREHISEHQYANYLNAIKYYLKDIKDLRNPIIHIASSSDREASNDSQDEGVLSEFTLSFKEIFDNGFTASYENFFKKINEKLKNPKPYLEVNLNNKKIKDFLATPIFNSLK